MCDSGERVRSDGGLGAEDEEDTLPMYEGFKMRSTVSPN